MSFAYNTKSELCEVTADKPCCSKAQAYGLLLFGRNFSSSAVSLVTENAAVARCAAELTAAAAGVYVKFSAPLAPQNSKKGSYVLTVEGTEQRQAVLSCFGHSGREINLRINRANIENDCCVAAFLRGVFLSCGSVTDPSKDYHLEFTVPFMNLAKDLCALLSELEAPELEPKIVNRKGAYIVYIKGGEAISDLLTCIGATNASMELMQIMMVKEVRNYVNRKTNFETANIDKTVSASAKQIEAIERIQDGPGLSHLPEELQEVAALRLENPEMSLSELGKMLKTPISRSGVNHRLHRILDISQEIT